MGHATGVTDLKPKDRGSDEFCGKEGPRMLREEVGYDLYVVLYV